MTAVIGETWEQRTFREIAEASARARADGEVRGKVEASREALRVLLEDRFGKLPQELNEQIEAVQDVNWLREALRQTLHITDLSELKLPLNPTPERKIQ